MSERPDLTSTCVFEWVHIEIDGDVVRLVKVKRNFWQRILHWLRWQRHMLVVRRDRPQHMKVEKDRAQKWDTAVEQELEEHAGAWERLARGEE